MGKIFRRAFSHDNAQHPWRLLKSPFNRLALLVLYIVLGLVSIYHIVIPDITVFPNEHSFAYNSYDDSAVGGNSVIQETTASETAIHVRFDLKDGFVSPYVGVTFWNKPNNEIDLSGYNEVRIEAKVTNLRGLSVSLFAPHTYRKKRGVNPEAILHSSLDMTTDRTSNTVRLDQMKVPDWWYHANEIEDTEHINVDLSQVSRINIGSLHTSSTQGRSSFTIYSVTFVKNNTRLFIILALLSVLLPVVFLGSQLLWKIFKSKPRTTTVEYRSVTIDEARQPTQSFMNYINENFHQPELTLEQVSTNTGIYDRRIAQYIQEHYDCNFKTYLNKLRIAESKRLLLTTELTAGEIAYKIGFTNQSHFNRVFKNLEKVSPTQYRNTHK